MFEISEKQADFLSNSNYDTNICIGSIRSGKTYISNLRFKAFLESEAIERVPTLITGKKADAAVRNVVLPFLEIAEKDGTINDYEYIKKPCSLIYKPKKVINYIEGAYTEGSDARIRGMTAQAWMPDEVTTYPKSFYDEAYGRVSAGKRLKFMTTNPDHPGHWFKKDVIDKIKDINANYWHFSLSDNPVLDPQYVEELKKRFTGATYDRKVLGKWSQAEGVCFDAFTEKNIVDNVDGVGFSDFILGVDWGYNHKLALLLFGISYEGNYYLLDEISVVGQLIDDSLKSLMRTKGWFNLKNGDRPMHISYAYCDGARPEYLVLLTRLTGISCPSASKEVHEGIQCVNYMLGNNKLFVLRKCVKTIDCINSYHWKVSAKMERDEPDKVDDDEADALRYAIYTRERSSYRVLEKDPFRSR